MGTQELTVDGTKTREATVGEARGPNPDFFRDVFGGAWITQGVWVAAELGIADLLVEGPRSVAYLAERTQTDAESLYRLLRALAGLEIFAEDQEGRFFLTPLAELLRSDIAESRRFWAIMMGAEFHQAWGELLHSVRTGESGFQKRYGAPFFEYMTERGDRHSIYDEAMTGVHGAETEPMLDAYDFGAFHSLVDVGGGNGSLLVRLLERFPRVQATLFDLPEVAARARPFLSGNGLSVRCMVVGGDFFESIPAGADAYVMRHIIHDWQDPEAIAILTNCRKAMGERGKLLLVETVIPSGNQPSFGKWLDLMMLLVGGRERTEGQYDQLLSRSGLVLARVIPTESEVSILECVSA